MKEEEGTVNDRGMIERIGDDGVLGAQDLLKQPCIGVKAAITVHHYTYREAID